nr:protein PHLOEM PROTEIN 2-LIKE A9-like [Coffea arabica]
MSSSNPHYEADPKASRRTKENGRDVIIVKPRALNIVWGNDDRYWNVPGPRDDGKPAELLQVSWLEVAGSVDADPQKTYDVSFRVSLTPDAFGWGSYPIYIMVKRGKFGKFDWKKVYLTNCDGINRIHLTGKSFRMVGKTKARQIENCTLACMKFGVGSGKEASKSMM